MSSRAKSKRLASGSSNSQASVGKTYSSRHAAKGTPPAVFAPMGNYNRSSLSSTEGGAGSAVKAEVTMTSTRKPKKGSDDVIDLCSDEEVSSDVNSSLSDDSPSGMATRSTAGSTGSSGRPSRYATRGLASANKENKENRAAPLSRKSPSPRGTPAIATPQTPASVASSTLSRTPATRTPPVTSSGYGNTGGSRVVHSPAASSGIPTPSILSSIVSEAGSLGRPPRSRRSSLGGRRLETEGSIDEAQGQEEEPQQEQEVVVEVDNDDGLHADTVLLKTSMREVMARLEELEELWEGTERRLAQDAKARLTELFNQLRNKPEAAVFVARDASAMLGRLLDLVMPRMYDDEEDIAKTRRMSLARSKGPAARMSIAPDAFDTPTGQVEHDSLADASMACFKEGVTDFRRERRLVTKREAELAIFQRKIDAYKADLDASASMFATKVGVLEARLAELTQALNAKDTEAQQLYEASFLPQASMGRHVWRTTELNALQDIASQGQDLLEAMDGLQADVDCTAAWLALLSFSRDTLVNAFVSAHKHAVDRLMDREKESLETLKTESASELVNLSVVVLEAFAAAQAHKAAALSECEAAVAAQVEQIDRVRSMGTASVEQVQHAAEETLTVFAQAREKMRMELGTLRSEMQELAENDMKDQYAEACRRVAQRGQQAAEGKGEEQGDEGQAEDGGDEDDTPEMRNCLIM